MGWIQTLEKVSEGHYVLPRTKTMRVHADLFLSDKLLYGEGPDNPGLEEAVFDQIVNATSFPGVTRVAVTPDCHVGYGVPIGTVVETDGILLPTAAGYDIGCGMVQLKTTLTAEDVADKQKRRQWIEEVIRRIAVGVGASRAQKQRKISSKTFAEVVRHGAKALGRNTSTTERDFIPVEDDTVDIPERAYDKRDQLGSLGGGNHFTEMQVDQDGRVWVMLHTGSRGFGWNIAKHFFVEGALALGLKSRSEDFVWLDADSKLGREYWNLHNMAANFAVANRLLIGEAVCAALEEVFGGTADIYYEISHNLIQKEAGKFVARKLRSPSTR
jgi:tRNA-splicing ligase RtcB